MIKNMGKISLVLWLVTVLIVGIYIIRGGAVQQVSDARNAIILSQDDRALVLEEMRAMLVATQQIIDGVARDDRQQIITAAKAGGMGSAIDLDPSFLSKLPLEFKTLGFSMHSDMDAISKAAEKQVPLPEISGMLAATLTKCVACHGAWELKIKE
jgi:hypothetical protein